MNANEDMFYIELRSRKRCLIDGIMKISAYGSDCITVEAKNGTISVKGTNLAMDHLSEERIGICGNIVSVVFGESNDK